MSKVESEDIELATKYGNPDIQDAGSHETREDTSRFHSERQAHPVSKYNFAGRIGGNQQFTISPLDPSYANVISKLPDATSKFTWKQSVSLRSLGDVDLWKQALLEGVGTCVQMYLAGMYAVGLGKIVDKTSLGPITPAAFGSIANVLLISLFIYAGGPVSGGHFNPLISMSAFFARLSTLPRTILYIAFQCTGAVVAGFLMRASLGAPPSAFSVIPGCYIDTSVVTAGEAFVLELMTSLALIFIGFGVGLDPRQREVFGPAISPLLVGLAVGLASFASAIVRPGYTGASSNPARCLGLMAAAERFNYHYIHWFGDLAAAMLNGLLYWLIPIHDD